MTKQRPKIRIRCTFCKKWCWKYKHHVRYNKLHNFKIFCSTRCHDYSQLTGKFFNCSICQKKIWRTQAEQRRSKSKQYFCSKHCATIFNNQLKVGDKHPNYKGTNYRKLGLKVYGSKCALCNYSNKAVVQVHHKDHNRRNNKSSNLIVLCPTHHWEVHLGVTTL